MRGEDVRSEGLFSYVSCEARVPADHPLRAIRAIVDEGLEVLSADFEANAGALRYGAIGLNELVDATAGARARIIVLDECRNWPDESDDQQRLSNNIDHMAQGERDWPNLLVAYATSARMGAGDGLASLPR